jgi:putative transposase
MKTSRFSDAQIMGILAQAENGIPVTELCREHGMSNASFYKWRAKYGGLDASMVSQMKRSYCQIWCLRLFGHAAIWPVSVVSIPSLNVTPVMTLAR